MSCQNDDWLCRQLYLWELHVYSKAPWQLIIQPEILRSAVTWLLRLGQLQSLGDAGRGFFPLDFRLQRRRRQRRRRRVVGEQHELEGGDGEAQKVWNLDKVVADEDAVHRPESSGDEVGDDHSEGEHLRWPRPHDLEEGDQRSREEPDGQGTADLLKETIQFYIRIYMVT